jgi:hypothetical protein
VLIMCDVRGGLLLTNGGSGVVGGAAAKSTAGGAAAGGGTAGTMLAHGTCVGWERVLVHPDPNVSG